MSADSIATSTSLSAIAAASSPIAGSGGGGLLQQIHARYRMATRPLLVAFGHHGADEPDHRLDAREHLHGASPALDLPVGALLDVIGPDAAAVLGWKRQVCERVALGILEQSGRCLGKRRDRVYGGVVGRAHHGGVFLREHRLHDLAGGLSLALRRQHRANVALEVRDAALPRSAGEAFGDGAPQPLVGVARDALHAAYAAHAQVAAEPEPARVGLCVDGGKPHDAADAVGADGYGGDHGGGLHAALAAALDVGGIQEEVRHGHVEFPRPKCGDFGIEPLAYAADLRRRQPVDSHPLRYALDLARRNPVGVHLGRRRATRLVRPAVSLQHPLGEIGSAAQLQDALRYLAGRRHQPALTVAVAAVGAVLAGHVGLLVHDRVEGRFEQRPGERLQVERFSSRCGHVLA